MFIDASAFCAIFFGEPEAAAFQEQIASAAERRTSAVAVWETVRAIVREQEVEVSQARQDMAAYMQISDIEISPIATREHDLALEAFDRFGKGRHPANLNMGDCFAYACARSLKMPLLFKGDDFSQTDIESVGA